jgi:hypothetical protein
MSRDLQSPILDHNIEASFNQKHRQPPAAAIFLKAKWKSTRRKQKTFEENSSRKHNLSLS